VKNDESPIDVSDGPDSAFGQESRLLIFIYGCTTAVVREMSCEGRVRLSTSVEKYFDTEPNPRFSDGALSVEALIKIASFKIANVRDRVFGQSIVQFLVV